MNLLRRFQDLKKLTEFGYGVTSVVSRTHTPAPASFYSILSPSIVSRNTPVLNKNIFLTPNVYSTVPVCGMKVKGRVRKRCRDCYMVYKDHRVFNYCKTKPKHNQMNKVEKEREYFILTELTHGRIRKY